MRHSVFRKFAACYIFIGAAGFLLVLLGGSCLTERRLEKNLSSSLYEEAMNIAASDLVVHNLSTENLDTVRENMLAVASCQDVKIWIINSENEIVVSTENEISGDSSVPIEDFDPTAWGGDYYQTGDFFGYFSGDYLSVIAPVTEDMATKGYVAIHYPMQELYQNRSGIVGIMLLLFAGVYALTFLLLALYRFAVHKPLQKITDGAAEFANGNLSYQIPLKKKEDEIRYLGNTLNYMAERLNKNGEFQRTFISNISHDFRSPLTSIKGYVEAMLDGTIPVENQEKYLHIISYEAGRLEKLTRSLLALNDLDVQKRQMHVRAFDINEIVKTTAATFEGICTRRRIPLELYLSGRELFVEADMEQIQQVLYNLLDNAIKFSPDGASIVLETTEKNEKVFVSVKDHGCGIPRESLPKIWERFYKTDVSRGKDRTGTGLGLAIVREIMNAHGEHVNVISTVGVGTEFIFSLKKA